MKLIVFNQHTLPKTYTKADTLPSVAFRANGSVYFNESAVKLMELTDDCNVSIAQDETNPSNWYAYVDDLGWKLRPVKKQKGLALAHNALVRTFIDAFGLDKTKSHNFLIAGVPTIVKGSKHKFWGILSKSN